MYNPYQFSKQDLAINRLMIGVECTLKQFYRWRDENSRAVADHIDLYTDQLHNAISKCKPSSRAARAISRSRERQFQELQIAREIAFFGVYDLAEVITPTLLKRLQCATHDPGRIIKNTTRRICKKPNNADAVIDFLKSQFPVLEKVPEAKWLGEQIHRLYRILPESVVQSGGMGKAVRVMVGVLTIGVYDTFDDCMDTRAEHIARILPAAYAYGATYPIVDDTLQDMPGEYIPRRDKERYHQIILQGLRTGQPIDAPGVPDHPLADELIRLYDIITECYPFIEYRHLYHAAEAMYTAQHIDVNRTIQDSSTSLTEMYPEIFIKAAMSRVVANILGRRKLRNQFYVHCINTTMISQFRDDLFDRDEDARAGRLTPFTYRISEGDTNPLYDLFAYEAYVARHVFVDEPSVSHILSHFGATKLARHLSSDAQNTVELINKYKITREMSRFLSAASGLSRYITRNFYTVDRNIQKTVGRIVRDREQTAIDPRTFVSDRLKYINDVIGKFVAKRTFCELDDIVKYALGGGGKRLRPALTLMLAEGLAVEYEPIEPLLIAIELFHTSSLIFDDLPAQDNARLRRGKPTAHTVFGESGAQLAAISMISSGYGSLAELGRHYSAQQVVDVVSYAGSALGAARLCCGQYLDLQIEKNSEGIDRDSILETYNLKTSTMIEASLVPLMMLTERSADEIEVIKKYSYHSGIVFQVRDDILDTISVSDYLGKDVGSDSGKVNIVRTCGLDEAERIMRDQLDSAIHCCNMLPFDTNLLQGVVRHFAQRNR